jgi:hypothetical protein
MKNKDVTYRIKKRKDKKRLEAVAERLYSEAEKWENSILSWEDLTEKYLWFALPSTDIQTMKWKQSRSYMVVIINQQMAENKYPCRLYVKHNQGVSILTKEAPTKAMTIRLKKRTNVSKTTFQVIEDLKESYPDAYKMLSRYQALEEDNLYSFMGRIQNSQLPIAMKRELKDALKLGIIGKE